MALSFSTVTAQNIHSVLRPYGSELAFTCTSTTSLAGKEIFVVPMFFVRSTDVQSLLNSSYPKYGYTHTYPGSNGTADMTKLSHDYDFCHENIRLSFTRSSTTQFTITPYGLTTMDVGKAPAQFQLDSADRCLKNHRLNPKKLDNVTPSVFNEDRVMRFYVVVTDGDYNVEQQGVCDINFTARWYEKGLYNVDSEWSDFDYKLFQNGTQIDGFSTHTDTTVRLQINAGSTHAVGGWWVYIFREFGQGNGTNYWTDIELNGKFFSGSGVGTAVDTIDSAAVSASSALTTISGNIKYVDIVIDKDYITKGNVYRVVFVPVKTNDFSNSFITDSIRVTDYIPPTSGNITDEIEHYTDTTQIYLNCVSGVAINERLRFAVLFDKTSYNDNIITNGSNGSFDENLSNYRIFITEQKVQDGLPLNYANAESVGDWGLINTSIEHGGVTTLRMRPEWSGKTLFLTHEWTFNIQLDNGLKSTDVTYYQQSFSVGARVDDTDIEFIGLFDSDNNEITRICAEDNEVIVARFKNLTPNTYNLIAYLENEENVYLNSAFVKLNSTPITVLPQTFDGSDLVDIKIDTKLLDIGKAYTLDLIGINDNSIAGSCGAETLDVTLAIEDAGANSLNMSLAYGSFSGSVAKVWVELNAVGSKWLGTQKWEFTSESDSDTFEFVYYPNNKYIKLTGTAIVDIQGFITVLTTQGCYIADKFNMNNVYSTKLTETKTITLD